MEKSNNLPKGITKRKDGRFMGRFQYKGESFTLYDTDNPKRLKKKMDDMKYEVEHGIFLKESNITLKEWFDIWIEEYKRPTVKEGTVEVYKFSFQSVFVRIKKMQLKEIKAVHIQKMFNEMAITYAKGTIKLVHVLLNELFKDAVKNSLVQKNPIMLVSLPRARERGERIVLSRKQQKDFLEYANNYGKFYPMYFLSLSTGMRLGEIRGLQWADVDFKNKTIFIKHTLKYKQGAGYYLDTPKTKTSKRDIPMIESVYKLLKDIRKKQNEQKLMMGKGWTPNVTMEQLVFATDEGKAISRERVTYDMNRIISAMQKDGLDIQRFTFHSLRHTFATRAMENDMKPKVLQSILGHSSLSMTMDLYAHVLPDIKVEEMKRMG